MPNSRTGPLIVTLQYLNAYLIGVHSSLLPLNVALDVVVAHGDAELDPVLHIDLEAVGVVLGKIYAKDNLNSYNMVNMAQSNEFILNTIGRHRRNGW